MKDEEDRKKSLDDFKNKKTNIRKVEKISSKNNKKNQKEDNLDRILFEDFEEKFIDLLNSKVEIKKKIMKLIGLLLIVFLLRR
ncbi:MAG: hypothetical protein ACLTA5_04030 [Anaerococcus obesiensis]